MSCLYLYYKQVSVCSLYAIQDFVCKNGPWETLIRIKHQPSQQIILQKEPSFFISCVFLVLQFIVSMAEEILPLDLFKCKVFYLQLFRKKAGLKKIKTARFSSRYIAELLKVNVSLWRLSKVSICALHID